MHKNSPEKATADSSGLNKNNGNGIFTVNDGEFNTSEIVREIESRLKQSNTSKEDIERISKLRFSPSTPAGYREFDPALAADLFEKGISPPKFTNPKLWFIRGPIRWAVLKFIEFYSLVDKKLSDNRIRAFFNVLHELILHKKQIRSLMDRQRNLEEEINKMKALSTPGDLSSLWNGFDSGNAAEFPGSEEDLEFIRSASLDKRTLVLFPGNGGFLHQLISENQEITALSFNEAQFAHIRTQITDKSSYCSLSSFSTKQFNPETVLIFDPLDIIPGWIIDTVLRQIAKDCQKDMQVICRYLGKQPGAEFVFTRNSITSLNWELLPEYLRGNGFGNLQIIPLHSGAGSLIRFKKV